MAHDHERVPRPRRVGGEDVALAFAAYFLFQTAGGFVAEVLVRASGFAAGDLAWVIVSAPALFLGAWLVVARRGVTSLGLLRASGRWLLLGVVLGLVCWLVSRGIILSYFWVTGDLSDPQASLADVVERGTAPRFALLMLFGGLLIPLGEELLFRGILYAWLRRWGLWIAVAISALVFGLLHGVNAVLPVTMMLGVLTALAYEKSGSLWPAVLTHVVYNTFGFGLARLLVHSG